MIPALHIVGSGPAGLAAAHAAVMAGAQVCLIDDNRAAGGQVWRGGPGAWNAPAADALWAALREHPGFTHVRDTRVVGAVDARTLLLEGDTGGACMPFERLLLCTGAREFLVPFPGWTLPGVTGAGGLQALVKGGMPVRGRRIVVAGSGPLLLASAATALAAGAQVLAIVEHQPRAALARFGLGLALRHHGKLHQALQLFARLRGVPYLTDALVVEAKGDEVLQTVVVETARGRTEYDCDFLAAGFGLLPNTELGQAFGCAIDAGALAVDERQQTTVPHIWAAGECTGVGGVDQARSEGRVAALCALGLAPSRADLRALRQSHHFAALLARHFAPRPALRALCRPGTIVCRCEDVTAAELMPWRDWREAKLATRVGMGPCQGSTCAAACALLFGWEPPAARIPILPANAGALASIE
ncbi:FAD/NAD(P)-dependent oxidoreductase [Pseudoduganella armeniaca]|uniref:FAD/NAD(P)-binding oxidoreductase n=1 Tax=Pseudoduganella armeniaca TaxID=2072590 RepID=A0A2R4C7W5_9BURK|nr:NAD(P)/FAD-dependent oxidoreductase [Pseudoduganella armeniaca]AVR95648.1 FAD/NAD(P)-binding oxidoreductase [Pseudoduganella armeniaca]